MKEGEGEVSHLLEKLERLVREYEQDFGTRKGLYWLANPVTARQVFSELMTLYRPAVVDSLDTSAVKEPALLGLRLELKADCPLGVIYLVARQHDGDHHLAWTATEGDDRHLAWMAVKGEADMTCEEVAKADAAAVTPHDVAVALKQSVDLVNGLLLRAARLGVMVELDQHDMSTYSDGLPVYQLALRTYQRLE